jgi:hypothetical protein
MGYVLRTIEPTERNGPALREWLVQGLAADLRDVAIARLFAEREDLLADCDSLVCASQVHDPAAVGVLAAAWKRVPSGWPFLHVTLQLVAQRHQRTNLLAKLWGEQLLRFDWSRLTLPLIFAWRTYHPAALGLLSRFATHPGCQVYPPVCGPPAPKLEGLAREIAATICPGAEFCEETGVIRGTGRPADLYRRLPDSRHQIVVDYFRAHLRAGDRVLCVLSLADDGAARRILRTCGLRARGRVGTGDCGVIRCRPS